MHFHLKTQHYLKSPTCFYLHMHTLRADIFDPCLTPSRREATKPTCCTTTNPTGALISAPVWYFQTTNWEATLENTFFFFFLSTKPLKSMSWFINLTEGRVQRLNWLCLMRMCETQHVMDSPRLNHMWIYTHIHTHGLNEYTGYCFSVGVNNHIDVSITNIVKI